MTTPRTKTAYNIRNTKRSAVKRKKEKKRGQYKNKKEDPSPPPPSSRPPPLPPNKKEDKTKESDVQDDIYAHKIGTSQQNKQIKGTQLERFFSTVRFFERVASLEQVVLADEELPPCGMSKYMHY